MVEATCKSVVIRVEYEGLYKKFEIKSKEFGRTNQFTKTEDFFDTVYHAKNLFPNRTYYFKARAYRLPQNMDGKWSQEIVVRTTKSNFQSIL